tara:strand:- start:113 stop:460 length:348 start_codon:yes stop_codon:yes gene_type:complete
MKIFFNNSCSICRSEINVYKKQGIKQLEWVDITNNKDAERDTQKTNKDLLRRLHVKSEGKIYSGAKAFIILWNRIPKFKILSKILSIPVIFHIFSLTYEIAAFFLYLKNRNQLKN